MATRSRLYIGAAWHDWAKASVFWLGAWHEVQRIRAWVTSGSPPVSGWRDVYVKGGTTPTPSPTPTPTPTPTPSITLSVTPNPSSVSGTRVGVGTVTTNAVTASVANGTPPYTYTFSRSTYSGTIVPTINTVAGQPSQRTFSRDMEGTVPETETARFKCRVTDVDGNAGTCYIDATFLTTTQPNTGGGWDGGPCVVEDTLELMANAARTGPANARPIGAAKVDDCVWTRHHLTGKWGAYRIIAQERSLEPVFYVPGLPLATKTHRSWNEATASFEMLHLNGRPCGEAWVIRQSVEDAQTYFTPGGGDIRPEGVLNHNVKPIYTDPF